MQSKANICIYFDYIDRERERERESKANTSNSAENLDHSYIASEKGRCHSHSGKQFGNFLKKLNMLLICGHALLTSAGFIPETGRLIFTQKPVHECLWLFYL